MYVVMAMNPDMECQIFGSNTGKPFNTERGAEIRSNQIAKSYPHLTTLVLPISKLPPHSQPVELPRARQGRRMNEALCKKCGETFNPHDECCREEGCDTPCWVSLVDDGEGHCSDHCLTLVHGEKADGTACGGRGEMTGAWIAS